jgi:hypothetical protein
MKITYTAYRPQKRTREKIDQINAILEEYAMQGFQMTIRQLYYQMVSRELIPFSNSEYDKLLDLIGNARNGGMIDWSHIVDRSRDSYRVPLFESVDDALQQAAQRYHVDIWEGMPLKPVIWFEKAGLSQIIGTVANSYNIEYMATRGENSLTWLHNSSQDRDTVILYLGDHDGHGVQISDGMAEKVRLYSGSRVQFHRIGISLQQGEEISAPKIPLKDVRNLSFDYKKRFTCNYGYEIDAFSPEQLANLLHDEVQKFIGLAPETYQQNQKRQEQERQQIMEAVA